MLRVIAVLLLLIGVVPLAARYTGAQWFKEVRGEEWFDWFMLSWSLAVFIFTVVVSRKRRREKG